MMMSSSMRQRSPELSRFERNHDESLSASNLDIKIGRSKSIVRESFKCSMACLYLPGFYKRKSMFPLPRSAQQMPESTFVSGTTGVSMALSLERYECSSSSSGIVFNLMAEEEGWRSPYYDLPVELIRKGIDAESPINAAFVFNCEPKRNIKGKRRPSSLAQSVSLNYVNKSRNHKLAWAPSSCPASPSNALKAFPIEEMLISSASINVRKHSN